MSITVQLPVTDSSSTWALWLANRPDIITATPSWAEQVELEPESQDIVYGTWRVSRGEVVVDQSFSWNGQSVGDVDKPRIFAGSASSAVDAQGAIALVQALSEVIALLRGANPNSARAVGRVSDWVSATIAADQNAEEHPA